MDKANFIPCLTFVSRGKANQVLEKVKHTKEELQEIIKEMKLKEAEYESRPNAERKISIQEQTESDAENEEVDNAYNIDDYDNEPTDPLQTLAIESLILNNPSESDSEDSDAEEDEFTVKPDDNLIVTGHVMDDVSMLEVYVFNNDNADFFMLHDIFLPTYPLCIEWMDFNASAPENKGHFAAMGYMTHEIDVWDLNTAGCLEPAFRLGRKLKKANRHTDAVLDLSWNTNTRNILASGSADNTVRLWDMKEQKSVLKLSTFEEKVQTIKFHSFEAQNLLCGDCAGHVKLYDCRNPSAYKTWLFEKEIERVLWNPFNPLCYFAATNTGMVHYVDIRAEKPIWNLKAHDSEVTGITLSSGCPDMFVTGSQDETVKVWDLKDNKPQLVTTKAMKIGGICSLVSCPDVPYVFCAGGLNKDNNLYLWDSRESEEVTRRFKDRQAVVYASSENTVDASSMEVEETETAAVSTTSTLSAINNNSEGRVRLKKKKSRKSVSTNREQAESGEPQAGPSSGTSTSNTATNKKKRDRKKMHPKTPK